MKNLIVCALVMFSTVASAYDTLECTGNGFTFKAKGMTATLSKNGKKVAKLNLLLTSTPAQGSGHMPYTYRQNSINPYQVSINSANLTAEVSHGGFAGQTKEADLTCKQ